MREEVELPDEAREWLHREVNRALDEGFTLEQAGPERSVYDRAAPWFDLFGRAFAALGRGLAEFGRFLTRLDTPAQILALLLMMFVTAFVVGWL